MWRGFGLCVKDGSTILTTHRWNAVMSSLSMRVCTDVLPYARSGIGVQIPKELFKKTWGITETLGEPRKTAMYLVRSSTEFLIEQSCGMATLHLH